MLIGGLILIIMKSKISKKSKMKIEKKKDLDSIPFMDGSYDPSYIYKA